MNALVIALSSAAGVLSVAGCAIAVLLRLGRMGTSERGRARLLTASRVMMGFGFALIFWVNYMSALLHRCYAGYKWFEYYGPLFIAALGVCSVIFLRRLWLGLSLAAAIYVGFYFKVAPEYIAWIHGPNAPRFPAAEARRARIQEDLRLIDDAALPEGIPLKPAPERKAAREQEP